MRPRVLVVDDELTVAKVLAYTLCADYDVHVASSGIEGLTAITSRGPYAAVLSDMYMPGMDGAAFLSRAYVLAPSTPRLLLTGHPDQSLARRTITEGRTFRFLTKPCPISIVRDALKEAVREYHATAELLRCRVPRSEAIDAAEIESPAVAAFVSSLESVFQSILATD